MRPALRQRNLFRNRIGRPGKARAGHSRLRDSHCSLALVSMLVLLCHPAAAQDPAPQDFFERQVLPILQQRCIGCHSEAAPTSGLSLESREALLAGGNRGPAVVPGDPEVSHLIRALSYTADLKMPPTGKLPDSETAILTSWVKMGLPWSGASPSSGKPKPRGSTHWAFQPIQRPPEPPVKNLSWVRNPIDRFVLARLEQKELAPSPEADRVTLIRRLSLDLTGLLPSLNEVDDFVKDARPDAYERLVDRILASPHYGERWGRHWLDLARYADSNGYNIDGAREMWMYRDWVIAALNSDLPFDQFIIEQVAGDLLPQPTRDQLVATGFHRNTLLNLEGGIDFEQYRADAVADRVDTTGAVFLGLTLGCARCHDHKYDPVSQREYYRLYAFFNSIDEMSSEKGEAGRATAHEPILEVGQPGDFRRREVIRAQIRALEKEAAERELEWESRLTPEEIQKLPADVQEVFKVPRAERNVFQNEALREAFHKYAPEYQDRRAGIEALRELEPKIPSTLIMRELPTPRESYVHLGGDFLRRGVTVTPGVPAVLPPLPAQEGANRLDLAKWLVNPSHPLTPRVTVNRVWQRYFGKGLVETDNDFGTQGSPPTHPELLDWLASEFTRTWSLKGLHRLIVTSATYRQSSQHRPDIEKVDPENRLLARQNRLRLEAEVIRDVALSASRLLTPRIGGPSVFPPQPAGASKLGQIQREWVTNEGADRYRRGLYTFFWRSSPHPGLMVFDAPDSTTTCTRRNRSNTPLQSLTLLNDEAFFEAAQGLAVRVAQEAPPSAAQRVRWAFRLCLSRTPQALEQKQLEGFFAAQLADFRRHPEESQKVLKPNSVKDVDAAELAALTSVSRVLLNLDEFITRE
ncbi:MAG: PSD1 and planctomycete cytochrome C domain-containing protein [Acidobacteriota bacterium]